MFNVYSIENQNFYLNDSLISGIQSLGISYDNNINPSIAIDNSNLNYFVGKPVTANLDLAYILSSNDRFISYTGSNSFSGKVEYGNNYFTFSSGYLTNYSLNYKFGEYPEVNTKSFILGELGNTSGTFSYTPKVLNNFDIGDNCYVDLNLAEADQNNRLESFRINIDIPRATVYTIGNYLPTNVIVKYPISISLNFQFSMSNYTQEKVTNIFTGIASRNLTLNFKKYGTNQNLLSLNLSNLINSETQLRYSTSDDAKLNLNFQTYILSGI
jgi:hypothetical protein